MALDRDYLMAPLIDRLDRFKVQKSKQWETTRWAIGINMLFGTAAIFQTTKGTEAVLLNGLPPHAMFLFFSVFVSSVAIIFLIALQFSIMYLRNRLAQVSDKLGDQNSHFRQPASPLSEYLETIVQAILVVASFCVVATEVSADWIAKLVLLLS